MIGKWDVRFDIASIIIIAVLFILYFSRKVFNSKKNSYYIAMLIIMFFSANFSIISSYIDTYAINFPLSLIYFNNIIYFILIHIDIIIFFRYTIAIIRKDHIKKLEKVIYYLALILIIALVSTTFIHKKIFYIENNVYIHGYLFYSMYYITMLLVLYCVVLAFINRKKITTIELGMIISFSVATFIAYLMQILSPNTIFVDFIGTLMLMMLYATIENPELYYDRDLNVYNYFALEYNLRERVYQNALVLTIFRYDYLKTKYQTNYKKAISEKVLKQLKKDVNIKNIYVSEEKNYIILLKKDSQKIAKRLLTNKKQFQSANDLKTDINFYLTDIKLLPEANKNLEVINYVIENHNTLLLNHVNEINYSDVEEYLHQGRLIYDFNKQINNKDIELLLSSVYSLKKHKIIAKNVTFRLPNIKNNEQIASLFEQNIVLLDKIIFDKITSKIDIDKYAYRQVNIAISLYSLFSNDFIEHVLSVLNKAKFSSYQFNFVLKELNISYDEKKLKANIKKLKNKGCLVILDNYGRGLNNIEVILNYGFNGIKIDEFLLEKIITKKVMPVLNIQIKAFKNLGIKTFVKGVNSKKIYNALNLKDIDYIEGDYIENN